MRALVILLAWLVCASAHADSLYVLPRSINAIFFNSYDGVGAPADHWTTVEPSQLGLPEDMTAVFVQGLMILTGGATAEICTSFLQVTPTQSYDFQNLIALKSQSVPGLILPSFGIGEMVVSLIGQGARQPFASWVPLVDGKFHWRWTRNTDGEWPERCSYAGNFVIQAYTRSAAICVSQP